MTPGGAAPRSVCGVVTDRYRQWGADAAIALVATAAQVAGTVAVASTHHHRAVPPLGLAVLTAGGATLLFRRRHPVAVLWAASGFALWYWSTGWPRGPIFEAQIVALVGAVLAGHRRAAIAALVAGFAAFQWVPELAGTHRGPTAVASLALGTWLLLLLVGSEWARARRQRSQAVARSLEEEARRIASDERLRIARELHDVLAHNISLINVQASTALHLADRQPERARAALATIKDASKEALVELRSVVGALRQVDEEVPRAPAPTLAHLGELVERSRAAGIDVRLECDEAGVLPGAVDQAAYRIVQEALTNVVRHARGSTATVRITGSDGAVVVEVQDDGRGAASPVDLHTGGHGVAGMRERARALGGNLQAGPQPGGGYRVRAWLPTAGARSRAAR